MPGRIKMRSCKRIALQLRLPQLHSAALRGARREPDGGGRLGGAPGRGPRRTAGGTPRWPRGPAGGSAPQGLRVMSRRRLRAAGQRGRAAIQSTDKKGEQCAARHNRGAAARPRRRLVKKLAARTCAASCPDLPQQLVHLGHDVRRVLQPKHENKNIQPARINCQKEIEEASTLVA